MQPSVILINCYLFGWNRLTAALAVDLQWFHQILELVFFSMWPNLFKSIRNWFINISTEKFCFLSIIRTKKLDGLWAVTATTLKNSFALGIGYSWISSTSPFFDFSLMTAKEAPLSSGNQSFALSKTNEKWSKIKTSAYDSEMLHSTYLSISCSIRIASFILHNTWFSIRFQMLTIGMSDGVSTTCA